MSFEPNVMLLDRQDAISAGLLRLLVILMGLEVAAALAAYKLFT